MKNQPPVATALAFGRRAASALLAAVVLAGSAGAAQAQPHAHAAVASPRIDRAWARPTVPAQPTGGAYLRITGGAAGDRLVGASAPAVARSVELHSMRLDGNVMRMREVGTIDVPAGATVELAPGGLHLMLMGLAQPLRAGSKFALTLRFEKAGAMTVEVDVTASPPVGATAGHSGHP